MTHTVLAFGELVWDVIGEREFIGGAPFNFAAHASRCGVSSHLYSRIGEDDRGRRARREMAQLAIQQDWIQCDPSRPTGWVDVTLDADGQPEYEIGQNAAWDAISAPSTAEAIRLKDAGFSALICGTLSQRSSESEAALHSIRRALPETRLVYDINLRLPFTPLEKVQATLPGTAIVKLNEEEARILSLGLKGRELSPPEFYQWLHEEFGTKLILITRGAKGCWILSESGVADISAIPATVASTVGAGDAFLAGFVAGWLQGLTPVQAAERAVRLGAWVVSRPEAVPAYSDELTQLFGGGLPVRASVS